MLDSGIQPVLTDRFDRALMLASDLHRHQRRKPSTVPYVSHLLSVAALVLEDGGSEEEAIAALLHDALEDCADRISAEGIQQDFGPKVRQLVEACTDTPSDFSGGEKPDWWARKRSYIDHIRSGGATRVSLADKVHNARSILRDHQLTGDDVWERFAGKKDGTMWYYCHLVAAFRAAGFRGFLIDELRRVVDELHVRSGTRLPECECTRKYRVRSPLRDC